jgi:tetratricopeptide (TPR) repeat protein
MGKVWLASKDDQRLALKVVHPHLLSEPGFFKRFLREAEIGKAVAHPNVVRCYDCDQLIVDGTAHAFLVMEYVEGQTLRELLDELETVPEELCRHIGREVSRGLAAIHEAGVVHRDLKPENVLITPDHEVKVMDLGVARLADEAMRLSMTGAFVGSVLYASPEHFKGGGEDLDGRADLFSLGVILYELASGAHPHPGDDFAGVLAKVMEERPRRLGERNPQVSAFFEEVVHALLAKDRDERFASGSELLKILEQGEKSTWWGRRAQTLRAETKRPLRRIRIPRETAVYGREDELGKLRALYDRARSGEGQIVLIEGEAGIGKTRLVDELIGRLQQDGEGLNFLFGSYPPGGAATAAGAWSTAYREQFGAEGLEETLRGYLTVTPILIPAFAALLRGEPPPEGKEPLTKDSLQTVFVHATRALAAERTTVVLIEDLHFAPEEGRAMFASLALAVPEHKILLVGTARPGLSEGWTANLQRLDHAQQLSLDRLSPKDLAKLLVDAFSSERLAEELSFRIATKSDGNPFFVFEIIRGLREGQFITRRPDGTWVSTQVIQEIEIPSSVVDLIQARTADLEEDDLELLDVAACCGYEFDPDLVAAVVDRQPIPVLRALGQLERKHRLVLSLGEWFVFDHHQVQETLYDGISPKLRRAYHAAIADALLAGDNEPEGQLAVEVCEHLLNGGQGRRTLPHLDAALGHLESSHLNARAIDLADRALAEEGLLSGLQRVEVLLLQAERAKTLGRHDVVRSAGREALETAQAEGGNSHHARAHRLLGTCDIDTGRFEEGREHCSIALRLARESGDDEETVLALVGVASGLRSEPRYEEALELCREALGLSLLTGDRRGEIRSRQGISVFQSSMGRDTEACDEQTRAAELAGEIGDREAEALALGNLAFFNLNIGRYLEAEKYAERALYLARSIGFRKAESLALMHLGNAARNLGRYEEAIEWYERHAALAREMGIPGLEVVSLQAIGQAAQLGGLLARCRDSLARARAIERESGQRRPGPRHFLNGRLYLALGEIERADEHLEQARAACRGLGLYEGFVLLLSGEAAQIRGRTREAEEFLLETLQFFRGVENQAAVAEVQTVLGGLYLEAGRESAARDALLEALALSGEHEDEEITLRALAFRARLPGFDAAPALELLAEHEATAPHASKLLVRYQLWLATMDSTHLEQARRHLEHLVDHAPEEYRESMIENVPLHRDIVAAWEEHGTAS